MVEQRAHRHNSKNRDLRHPIRAGTTHRTACSYTTIAFELAARAFLDERVRWYSNPTILLPSGPGGAANAMRLRVLSPPEHSARYSRCWICVWMYFSWGNISCSLECSPPLLHSSWAMREIRAEFLTCDCSIPRFVVLYIFTCMFKFLFHVHMIYGECVVCVDCVTGYCNAQPTPGFIQQWKERRKDLS